jgi:molybdopterin converting factor small subunit
MILPSVWTEDGTTVFEAAGEGPLDEVVKGFAADHPRYRRRLLDADGQPLRYVNICVDDELIPRHLRATTQVPEGATVTVVAPMAGG